MMSLFSTDTCADCGGHIPPGAFDAYRCERCILAETTITATNLLRDEGTLVVFQGEDEDGTSVTFAVEHRYARDIAAAIVNGETPVCMVPDHLVISRHESGE
jgi:hypothetical protein